MTVQRYPSVFIAHAQADRDLARQVAQRLEHDGFPTRWDEHLVSGTTRESRIITKVASADVYLVLLTVNSAKSPSVRAEIDLAKKYQKPIFPIVSGNQEMISPFGLVKPYHLENPTDYTRLQTYLLHWQQASPVTAEPLLGRRPRASASLATPVVGKARLTAPPSRRFRRSVSVANSDIIKPRVTHPPAVSGISAEASVPFAPLMTALPATTEVVEMPTKITSLRPTHLAPVIVLVGFIGFATILVFLLVSTGTIAGWLLAPVAAFLLIAAVAGALQFKVWQERQNTAIVTAWLEENDPNFLRRLRPEPDSDSAI